MGGRRLAPVDAEAVGNVKALLRSNNDDDD
jgi:hypothetical protein